MKVNVSLIIKILIGIVGYGVWAFMSWFDPTLRPDFLKFNIAMAVGTIGLVLRDMQAPPAATSAQVVAPPADKGQGGFSRPLYMVLVAVCAVTVALQMTGCASMMDAGHSAYTFEPVLGPDGKVTGYKFNAADGKEYSSRNISVMHDGQGGVAVQVQEGASTAFQGQAIAEKALSILPSFAPVLLPPGPASLLPNAPQAVPALPVAPAPAPVASGRQS